MRAVTQLLLLILVLFTSGQSFGQLCGDVLSGNFISTTLEPGNFQVLLQVLGNGMFVRLPNLFKNAEPEPLEVFEYKLEKVVGIKIPDEYGIPDEKEVVTSHIPKGQITHFRKLQVNKWNNEILESTDWSPFPPQ